MLPATNEFDFVIQNDNSKKVVLLNTWIPSRGSLTLLW